MLLHAPGGRWEYPRARPAAAAEPPPHPASPPLPGQAGMGDDCSLQLRSRDGNMMRLRRYDEGGIPDEIQCVFLLLIGAVVGYMASRAGWGGTCHRN
jgi:hypothetical protein